MINEERDRNKVASENILRYYFRGDFGVLFSSMHISLMPRVLSLKEEGMMIFRLLKNIPALCRIFGKEIVQEQYNSD